MRRTTGYLTAFNACLTVASGQTYLVLPMVTDPAADSASEQPGRIIDAPSERGKGEGPSVGFSGSYICATASRQSPSHTTWASQSAQPRVTSTVKVSLGSGWSRSVDVRESRDRADGGEDEEHGGADESEGADREGGA